MAVLQFAKSHRITNLKEMTKELDLTSYEGYKDIYVWIDIDTIHISRVLEGYNDEYDREDGKIILEQKDIFFFDLINFLNEEKEMKIKDEYKEKGLFHDFIEQFDKREVAKWIIDYDDFTGLESDDYKCFDNIKDVLDIIDGGFGILEV